jgi:tRNA(adenine34) deaminase
VAICDVPLAVRLPAGPSGVAQDLRSISPRDNLVVSLEQAVMRALELAWTAFGGGTVPVGAVVTDASGTVVFEGRSRMYERTAPAGELANSLLAHAEVNALTRLDPNQRHEALTITSTLEPCPLCLGAIHMSTVGRLIYLGADPYGGAVGRMQTTPHTARSRIEILGPRADGLGCLASALLIAFYLKRNPGGHVVSTHRRLAPAAVSAGEAVLAAGLTAEAAARVPFLQALPDLSDTVAAADR